MPPSLTDFTTLTFDVVGTLIDFESGILEWFRPYTAQHGLSISDATILTTFADIEDRLQKLTPKTTFTDMLPLIYTEMVEGWELAPTDDEAEDFRHSIQQWPAFPDTVEALGELGERYRLAAMTNADSWAFDHMSRIMGDPFDDHFTCDIVGVNKPSLDAFRFVLERLGVAKTEILHTAQSQYHDIVPATQFGLSTMWIERRHADDSSGATPEPAVTVRPTFHATGLADFARLVREATV